MIRKLRKAQIQKIKYELSKLITNDSFYDKLRYFLKFKRLPNLKNPQTFNEKIIYKKQNKSNYDLSNFTDKLSARKIVLKMDESILLPKIYDIVDEFRQIDFINLPEKFIIKTNHGSGWNLIVRDKSKSNYSLIEKICKIWLSMDYYYLGREYAYKNIPPKLYVEELLLNDKYKLPTDIKLFCFQGKVKLIQLDIDREYNHSRIMLDGNWNTIPVEYNYSSYGNHFSELMNRDMVIQIAENLSSQFDFVRIDLYIFENKLYFGEFTFYPECGLGKIKPLKFDLEWGKLIT